MINTVCLQSSSSIIKNRLPVTLHLNTVCLQLLPIKYWLLITLLPLSNTGDLQLSSHHKTLVTHNYSLIIILLLHISLLYGQNKLFQIKCLSWGKSEDFESYLLSIAQGESLNFSLLSGKDLQLLVEGREICIWICF